MAWIQSPDGKTKLRIRQGTVEYWTYYRAGWLDVTKPASEKQTAQRKSWRENGEVAAAVQFLRRLRDNSIMSGLSKNCIDTLLGSIQLDLRERDKVKDNGNG